MADGAIRPDACRPGTRRGLATSIVVGALAAGLSLPLGGAHAVPPTGTPGPPSLGGRVKSGTGFFVSAPGYLVTSWHVVAGCSSTTVWPEQGGALNARTVAADQRHDIALLTVDRGDGAVTAWRLTTHSTRGEPVTVIGFGIMATHPRVAVLTHGSVAGRGTLADGDNVLYLRVHLHHGDSGAPVIDRSGAVLGMTIGHLANKTDIGVAITAADIRRFLSWNGIAVASGGDGPATAAPTASTVLVQCDAPP